MSFLFWLFLIGILIALFQDLKRTEVDYWLCLLFFFSGGAYIVFDSLSSGNLSRIFQLCVFTLIIGALSLIMYYSRIFAGGDSNLLFAMTPVFIAESFSESFLNVFWFVFILLFAGAVYGFCYSLYLFLKNQRNVSSAFSNEIKKRQVLLILVLGFLSCLFFFVDLIFLLLGAFLIFMAVLYAFAKSIDSAVMINKVNAGDLQEGDWLLKDVMVGGKIVVTGWGGLSKKDIQLLRKHNRKVRIRKGFAFVPAFLIAFLIYSFVENFFLIF